MKSVYAAVVSFLCLSGVRSVRDLAELRSAGTKLHFASIPVSIPYDNNYVLWGMLYLRIRLGDWSLQFSM